MEECSLHVPQRRIQVVLAVGFHYISAPFRSTKQRIIGPIQLTQH